MALFIDREPKTRFGNGAFLADAGENVREWPALRRVVEHVVDGNEWRPHAIAKLGQKTEPARFVAAITIGAGEEAALRRRAGQRFEPFAEARRQRFRRQRNQHLAFT